MKLAIIIPTYDNLSMLKRLIRQAYLYTDRFILYIIEDGRREKNVLYLNGNLPKNCKVLFHEKNEGVARCWNDGITKAMADNCTHFAILNDDIELCPNWWEKCKEKFDKENIHLLSLDQFSKDLIFTGWFFILDKTAIEKVGLFDEQFGPFTSEDMDYSIRYKKSGLKWGTIDLPIIHHGGVTTGKIRKQSPEYFKKIWNENVQKLKAKHPGYRMQEQMI